MTAAANLICPFYRATNGGRFRIGSAPSIVVEGRVLSTDAAAPSLETIMSGVHSHAMVTTLWQGWQ
jgi:hypothetical protein